MNRLSVGIVSVLLIGGVSACSSSVFGRVRDVTYAPGLSYVDSEQIESAMGKLAAELALLERLLGQEGPVGISQQEQVVEALRAMRQVTNELNPGGWTSNHPDVRYNVEAFRGDLSSAIRGAEHSPPNYFFAGSVSAACTRCHGAD